MKIKIVEIIVEMRFKVHLLMIRISLLFCMLLGMAGCSQTGAVGQSSSSPIAVPIKAVGSVTMKQEPAKPLTINITAKANINPNKNNRPSPLNIRIYQLSNSNVFNNSGFFELFGEDDKYLMRDLVQTKNDYMIAPGGTLNGKEIIMDKQTEYIGVFAAFQKAEESESKLLFRVDSKVPLQLCLLVDGAKIKQSECS